MPPWREFQRALSRIVACKRLLAPRRVAVVVEDEALGDLRVGQVRGRVFVAPPMGVAEFEAGCGEDALSLIKVGVLATVNVAAVDLDLHRPFAPLLVPVDAGCARVVESLVATAAQASPPPVGSTIRRDSGASGTRGQNPRFSERNPQVL